MSNDLMILDVEKSSVAFTAGAALVKERALTSAASVYRVTSGSENDVAAAAQLSLANIRRSVEKARVDAKEPFLEIGRQIDKQAKAFVSEVSTEELRIGKLIGDYHQLQEAKRKAAEELARLEAERIEQARIAEERRIMREAAEKEAAARREAEALASKARAEAAAAQRKIDEAKNAEARAKAVADAEKQRVENERAAIELKRQQELSAAQTHDQLDAAQERASNAQAAVAVPVASPVRAQGQTLKADIEILSVDVHRLYRTHPNCLNLTALDGEIKNLIRAGVKPPGVTFREIVKAGTRGSRTASAIEV